MKFKAKALPASSLAVVSALLFGASTPAAKYLSGTLNTQLLAGLLYLGSGLGLLAVLAGVAIFRKSPSAAMKLEGKSILWLAAAILSGGVFAPVLLMIGLRTTSAGSTSLLLNLEAVFTTLLAWFAFKENFDRRIVLGMVSIFLGSVILSLHQNTSANFSMSSLAIVAACGFWALDNNLTRNIPDADAVQTGVYNKTGVPSGSRNWKVLLNE